MLSGQEYLIGIDIGTSSCKAILIDNAGKVIAKEVAGYPLFVPHPGWTEQNPEDWFQAVKQSIKKLLVKINKKNNIKALGLSGQMHGLVALDKDGKVLRPCILWNDQRSAPQCEKIYERVGGEKALLSYTNNSMLPGYTGGKILWVRENEPHIYEKIVKVLLPKDYIRYRLTGELATDVSDASGTGLFDVKKRCWSNALIDILEIPKEWLPSSYESSEITGFVSDVLTNELGLPPLLPVVGGGGDAVIQSIGAGAINEETVMVLIGTAGIVSTCLSRCHDNSEGKLQFFCNTISHSWVAMGVTLAAGGSLRWFRDTLGDLERMLAQNLHQSAYDIMNQEAINSPPGSRGLIFLPYLGGERCPYTDPDAKGAFIGLRLHTTKSDIIRSVYEGVMYSLRHVLELMYRMGICPSKIRFSGGGAHSSLLRQIMADVFNKQVTTVCSSEEGGALAAAIIAGVGTGIWPTVKEAVSMLKIENRTDPVPENVKIYEKLFYSYKKLYSRLKPTFHELSCEDF